MSTRFARAQVILIFLATLGVILGTSLARAGPEPADPLAPILAGLPERITAAIAEDRLVSVSLAIVQDGEIVYCQALGQADLAEPRPATPATIYPMASITKVFTAIMFARLAEQGVVGLEDPVSRYLPEYRPRSPFAGTAPTTLRQLAAHTSGLPQDAPVNFWCSFSGFSWLVTGGQSPLTWFVGCDELLASLGDLELVHRPEVHAHYSNLNLQLLGLALERACGQPFVTYVEQEILAPLGMSDSGFTVADEQRRRLATGYVCTGPDAAPLVAPEYELGCAVYSGGLFTTAGDLARLLSWMLAEDEPDRTAVLEVGNRRRMRTPQSIRRAGVHTSYGLAWGVVQIGGHDAIEHNGALLGYHAHVSAVPELGLGIVALSNTKNYLWRPDGCKALARGILADLADVASAARQSEDNAAAAVDLDAFAGRYALPGGVAHLEVAAGEDGLHVTLVEVPDFAEEFVPVAPLAFCFRSDPGCQPMLFFAPGTGAEMSSVEFLSHTFRRVAP